VRLGGFGLDCNDPVQLSEFWAALLGGEIIYTSESLAVVKLGDLFLNAYHVEDHRPPTWPQGPTPKQAHIDLDVDDLPKAEERALSLGARAEWQPDPDSHLVLLDPAGHPFCLSTQFSDWRPTTAESAHLSGWGHLNPSDDVKSSGVPSELVPATSVGAPPDELARNARFSRARNVVVAVAVSASRLRRHRWCCALTAMAARFTPAEASRTPTEQVRPDA